MVGRVLSVPHEQWLRSLPPAAYIVGAAALSGQAADAPDGGKRTTASDVTALCDSEYDLLIGRIQIYCDQAIDEQLDFDTDDECFGLMATRKSRALRLVGLFCLKGYTDRATALGKVLQLLNVGSQLYSLPILSSFVNLPDELLSSLFTSFHRLIAQLQRDEEKCNELFANLAEVLESVCHGGGYRALQSLPSVKKGKRPKESAAPSASPEDSPLEVHLPSGPNNTTAKQRTVYVCGIDTQVAQNDLSDLLSSCGEIIKARLCASSDANTVFGFFEYRSREGALRLLKLNQTVLGRFVLKISPSSSCIRDRRGSSLELMEGSSTIGESALLGNRQPEDGPPPLLGADEDEDDYAASIRPT
eukprot:TRINITY_DN8336_c1_g1_i1.p1 TRINITY_DN8336_c1_g1~~TRINITY_DN8336_c1_g1_i1.p1  ORF type:complete len:402 (+),score=82.38 TRINITY_DN8336_c1_g1_i1:127-1206(+)